MSARPAHPRHCRLSSLRHLRRQRGVALLTALLVVSLATVAAAAMASRFQIDLRRTGNLINGEQAYAYAVSAESWAYVVLRRDLRESKHDSLDEEWATALPPLPVEGGYVKGRVTDLQGRFNVNNLVNIAGSPDTEQVEYFKRLLDRLGLDSALATALLDWIDSNIESTFPDGAEDEDYLLGDLPYRTANRPLTDISELRLVKGFTPAVMVALEPHVTALPTPTVINVNTATPMVLLALHEELDESDIESLLADREDTPQTDLKEFLARDELAGLVITVPLDVRSGWFHVLTEVGVGQGQARLESVVYREGNSLQVVSRTRTAKRVPEEEE